LRLPIRVLLRSPMFSWCPSPRRRGLPSRGPKHRMKEVLEAGDHRWQVRLLPPHLLEEGLPDGSGERLPLDLKSFADPPNVVADTQPIDALSGDAERHASRRHGPRARRPPADGAHPYASGGTRRRAGWGGEPASVDPPVGSRAPGRGARVDRRASL